MNKTKIDWCDRSWNPITGCLHDCPYCYARGIARRFGGASETTNDENGMECHWSAEATGKVHVLDEPLYDPDRSRKAPYPYGFDPTLHRYKLDWPQRIQQPQTIFVGSMADVFGEWVPDEWIKAVFEACAAAPWHRYLFLTKNPARYASIIDIIARVNAEIWLGSTVTSQNDDPLTDAKFWPTFVSVEPITENVMLEEFAGNLPNWVIVGAETGNRRDKVIPKREWVEDILTSCRLAKVPVFMKNNLADIWGAPLVQEFPWEVRA